MQLKQSGIPPDTPLSEAMERLGRLEHQFLAILEDELVVGSLTDGDVRRAMLKGLTLAAPVSDAMNRSPTIASTTQSSSELRAIMVQKQLRYLPLVDPANRFAGTISLEQISSDSAPKRALVMAGGLGQRLRPLTENVPKPMLDVGGVPLLETLIRQLASYGFREISISINYLGEQIQEHFGDGSNFEIKIDYITETERMGTVGAASLLQTPETGPLLVMNGDILTTINFRALMDFHQSTGADMTMGVRTYKHQVPYGVVNTHGLDITSIDEKPELEFFVNAGLYVLEPAVLARLPKKPMDMTDLVAELLNDPDARVTACPVHEYWQDIGREQDLLHARKTYDRFFLNRSPVKQPNDS